MKQFVVSLFIACAVLGAISPRTSFAGPSDYALMSATPYNSEIAQARERLEKFLTKADAKKRTVLAQNPIVAVEAYVLSAGEVGPILRRLNSGKLGTYIPDFTNRATTEVKFLLLFDSRTGQLVSDDGVLVINTPQRGKVGIFGGIPALYIGKSW